MAENSFSSRRRHWHRPCAQLPNRRQARRHVIDAGESRQQPLAVAVSSRSLALRSVHSSRLRLLAKLGLAADAVANGEEVLAALQHTPCDVILMDCQMPELDGYETTRRLRQEEASTPGRLRQYIIAVTAHALDGDREQCLEAGIARSRSFSDRDPSTG